MLNKLRQTAREDALFYCLVAIYAIFHFAIQPSGDDLDRIAIYTAIPYKNVLWDVAYMCTVSHRWITYFIVFSLCHLRFGLLLWSILDSFVLFVILKCISYLFVNDKRLNLLVALLVAMYPFSEMVTAGAMSTTIGYTWILASALLSLSLLKKAASDRLTRRETLFFACAMTYAAGQEQSCIVLFFILGFLCAQALFRKNKHLFSLCCLAEAITCVNLFFMYLTMRTGKRSFEIVFFRDFISLSLVDKFEMTLSSTLERVLFTNSILLLCTGIVLFILCRKTAEKRYLAVGIVPFVICLVGSTDLGMFGTLRDAINTGISDSVKYGTITVENYHSLASYFQLFVMCAGGLMFLFALFLVGNSAKEGAYAVSLIVLGTISRMILMFTVNVYLSSTRTFLFLWFCVICAAIYVVDRNYDSIFYPYFQKKNLSGILQIVLPILAVCALINNMFACI